MNRFLWHSSITNKSNLITVICNFVIYYPKHWLSYFSPKTIRINKIYVKEESGRYCCMHRLLSGYICEGLKNDSDEVLHFHHLFLYWLFGCKGEISVSLSWNYRYFLQQWMQFIYQREEKSCEGFIPPKYYFFVVYNFPLFMRESKVELTNSRLKCYQKRTKDLIVSLRKSIKMSHYNNSFFLCPDPGFAPGWHLEHIDVKDEIMDKTFRFPCDRWLSKNDEDGQIMRELPCGNNDYLDLSEKTSKTFKKNTSDGWYLPPLKLSAFIFY